MIYIYPGLPEKLKFWFKVENIRGHQHKPQHPQNEKNSAYNPPFPNDTVAAVIGIFKSSVVELHQY